MEINDSVALVTGGGSGIGEVIAYELARKGCSISVVDMDEASANRVAEKIIKEGGKAISTQANVVDEADTEKFIELTIDSFEKLNIVIPCAGIIRDGLFINPDKEKNKIKKKLDISKWKSVIDVNLTGSFLTIRDCSEAIFNGKWPGLIIPISSINKVGQLGQLNYSSTKVAISLFPKILIGEFMMRGIKNIRVVGLAPGYTSTALVEKMDQSILDSLIKDVCLGRLIDPKEIASLVMHCIQNEALNGTTIEITGGICHPGSIAK
ncbi:MAG: hypothetical protein CBD16_06380 [Betaproteobacteria bacterium TMED156]|nr:MAG: hypothetical protein CBD16_06380 [Betaproteobacteria bacterium TMED156]